MTTATKDMWVANLVEPWKGDSSSMSVTEFFESLDEAAEMGRLTMKDKVHLAKLKLKGIAKAFYSAQPELRADDITYAAFKAAFISRFKDKHTDQYHYNRVQNATQEKGESPEMFLDRLRKLCQRTVRISDNAVEQAVINQEADRRLLAAFINGLQGLPGKHVRLQMPDNVDRALHMAIIATNADNEEKALGTADRGNNVKVFAVRGSRGNAPVNRYEGPRGKIQWSGTRGAGSQHSTGLTQYSRRVDGTYSDRTGRRTPTDARDGRRRDSFTDAGDGHGRDSFTGAVDGRRGYLRDNTTSGPKNDDDRYAPRRPCGIRCYNCGLVGHTRSSCPRGHPPTDARDGRRRDLNGIGRTRTTPSSNPK